MAKPARGAATSMALGSEGLPGPPTPSATPAEADPLMLLVPPKSAAPRPAAPGAPSGRVPPLNSPNPDREAASAGPGPEPTEAPRPPGPTPPPGPPRPLARACRFDLIVLRSVYITTPNPRMPSSL